MLWTQHHCGIWRSSDNGASWQECEAQPSSFGFAVAVHPREPDTAWFAPGIKDERRMPVDAALCVTRTRDGGKSFEALRARACRRRTATTWSTATAWRSADERAAAC